MIIIVCIIKKPVKGQIYAVYKGHIIVIKIRWNSAGSKISSVFPRTELIAAYLFIFHRHHGANARMQSFIDDKQPCRFVRINIIDAAILLSIEFNVIYR